MSVTPNEAERHGLALKKDGQRRSAMDILSYPNIGMADVIRVWPQLAEIPETIAQQIEIDAKYAVYLDRQAADVAAYRRDEGVELPEDLDYAAMTALSMEVRQRLEAVRPRTIGQAGRIDGMTPAALTLLVAHLRRGKPKPAASPDKAIVRADAPRPGAPQTPGQGRKPSPCSAPLFHVKHGSGSSNSLICS